MMQGEVEDVDHQEVAENFQEEEEEDSLEGVLDRVEGLLKTRWVTEDQCRWTIFEDLEDELSYHRRRSQALGSFVRAYTVLQQECNHVKTKLRKSEKERHRLSEAGLCLQERYEMLEAELQDAVGEAAYWQELAKVREHAESELDSSCTSPDVSGHSVSPQKHVKEPGVSTTTSEGSPRITTAEEDEEDELQDFTVEPETESDSGVAQACVPDAERDGEIEAPFCQQEEVVDVAWNHGACVYEEGQGEQCFEESVAEEPQSCPGCEQPGHTSLSAMRAIVVSALPLFPVTFCITILFMVFVVFLKMFSLARMDLVKDGSLAMESLFNAIIGKSVDVSANQHDVPLISDTLCSVVKSTLTGVCKFDAEAACDGTLQFAGWNLKGWLP